MRIAMIFTYLESRVGSVSVFLSLADELQKQGNKVDIYTYSFDEKACFPELTANLNITAIHKNSAKSLNFNSIQQRFKAALDYYTGLTKIYHKMRGKQYDVVLANEAPAYLPALKYKKKYKVPVFWSVHDPITLIDSGKKDSTINRHWWMKILLSIHNYFDSKNIRKIDTVFVPTQKMKKQFEEFYGIKPIIFSVAGIRTEIKDYTSVIEKRLLDSFNFQKRDNLILLSAAHFQPHRRFEDVLDALAILQNKGYKKIVLILSGSNKFDPGYFKSIQQKIIDLHLSDKVILDTSFKTNNEVTGYYQFSDIFIFACVEQTWGLAPLEAMNQHKPSIVSSGVGSSEVMENQLNAMIVPEKSPSELARAIEKLYTDKDFYKAIAENGYNLSERYKYESIAQELVQLFKSKISL